MFSCEHRAKALAWWRSAWISGLLFVAMGFARTASPAPAPAPGTNVLIILADDLGYADVGFQGGRDIPTPNLDALAKSGVRFRQGYVTGPYCSPTRAALLAGRYQQRFGNEFNPVGHQGLGEGVVTIAERFRHKGYVTGLIGKWHLGEAAPVHPLRHGFDEFFGFLGGLHAYFPSDGIWRGTNAVREERYLTDAFGEEAAGFVKVHAKEPFLLYLAFNAAHTPLQADPARLAKFERIHEPRRRRYAAMVSAMDDAVGRVLEALRNTGTDRRTIIFFLSDNGGPTMDGTTRNGASTAPLRGSKRTTLEGGIRVPFVIAWQGQLRAGQYDQPVSQLDILPTAFAAAGLVPESSWQLDGVNLLPYLGGEKAGAPHDALYWRLGPQMAIRVGDWKLVRYDIAADGKEKSKVPVPDVTPLRLYRISRDPGERRDLWKRQPAKSAELLGLWERWNAELVSPWNGQPSEPPPGSIHSAHGSRE
jgi:arylsulfatase A-like enzyme